MPLSASIATPWAPFSYRKEYQCITVQFWTNWSEDNYQQGDDYFHTWTIFIYITYWIITWFGMHACSNNPRSERLALAADGEPSWGEGGAFHRKRMDYGRAPPAHSIWPRKRCPRMVHTVWQWTIAEPQQLQSSRWSSQRMGSLALYINPHARIPMPTIMHAHKKAIIL